MTKAELNQEIADIIDAAAEHPDSYAARKFTAKSMVAAFEPFFPSRPNKVNLRQFCETALEAAFMAGIAHGASVTLKGALESVDEAEKTINEKADSIIDDLAEAVSEAKRPEDMPAPVIE